MESRYPFQNLRIAAVLDRLHDAAKGDKWKLARRAPRFLWFFLNPGEMDQRLMHVLFHDVYIPVSREQGALLYLIGRAIQTRRVVEFGSSFGISTIYLATAVLDNMNSNPSAVGQVIGSENDHSAETQERPMLESGRCSAVRDIIARTKIARLTKKDPGKIVG